MYAIGRFFQKDSSILTYARLGLEVSFEDFRLESIELFLDPKNYYRESITGIKVKGCCPRFQHPKNGVITLTPELDLDGLIRLIGTYFTFGDLQLDCELYNKSHLTSVNLYLP